MTVPTTTNKAIGAGNGVATVFPFTFGTLPSGDLVVTLIDPSGAETVQVENTDYTVLGKGAEDGGSVVFVTPPGDQWTVLIQRIIPVTQPTDFKNQGSFYPRTHERSFDRGVMIDQQLTESDGRTVKIPAHVQGVSTELPVPVGDGIWGWDASGTVPRYFTPGEIATAAIAQNWNFVTYTGDGIQDQFTLPDDPGSIANMDISIDGVTQVPVQDYTQLGTALTFTTPPANGATILVRYGTAIAQGVGATFQSVQVNVTAGQTVVPMPSIAPGAIQQVYIDGLLQAPTAYFVNGHTITFSEAIPSDGVVVAIVADGAYSGAVSAAEIAYTAPISGAVTRSLRSRLGDSISVTDFGADPTGATDSTEAFNELWQCVRDSFVNNVSEDYVTRIVLIPPGVYRVEGSVNWCDLKARNVHVIGWGAVIRGYGAANNTIDMIGSRWVQVHGLTVFGDEADPPKCGILIGPERSGVTDVANGNNYFNGVNVTGYFVKTALWNIGSETTTYVRARFANRNTAADAYVYLGDGAMSFGATSAHMTLRPAATQVSFTNNKFYSCDFRNLGGGNAVAIEATSNWGFDNGCYFLSFNAANIQVYLGGVGAHTNLSIDGLFENAQTDNPTPGNTGCKYTIEFVTNGLSHAVNGFTFRAGIPHYANACMKITGGSAVALRNAEISINRGFAALPFFDAAGLTISGRLTTNTPAEMNLNGIAEFNGYLYTRNFATQPLPPAGAYVLVSEDDAVIYQKGLDIRLRAGAAGADVEIGNELDTRVSILGQSTYPRIRALGTAADIDLQLEAKGAGHIRLGTRVATADAPISGYIEIKDAGGAVRKLAVIT